MVEFVMQFSQWFWTFRQKIIQHLTLRSPISDHHCKHHYPSKSYGAFVFRNHSKNDEQVHSILLYIIDVWCPEFNFEFMYKFVFTSFFWSQKTLTPQQKNSILLVLPNKKKEVNSPFFSTFNILKVLFSKC